jgi:long-subunit fatty acid transport protein
MRKLIISAMLLVPVAASAGGYIIPNGNPREIGLSQADVAAQNGAEAVFINPSALAGQEGLIIAAGGQILINRTDWSDTDGRSDSIQPQLNTPPAIAVAYGAKLSGGMAWAVGAGLDVPAGGSIVWPKGWAGQERIQSVKQLVFGIHAAAALRPLPFLKLGVSYKRLQAQEELHQSINFLSMYSDAGLAMSGGANGFSLSAELKVPSTPLTIGIHYLHSADLEMSGRAHLTDVPPAFQALLHDQDVTAVRPIPKIFYVGAAYDVKPNLKLMTSYNYEGWSVYKSDKFVGGDGFVVEVPRDYKAAHVIRAAGELQKPGFMPELTLRAGMLRSISEQPTYTLSPSLTDGSSWAFSVGGGYNINERFRVDLGYQHAFFDSVTATQTTPDGMAADAFPGTYETQVDLISVGVAWRTDFGAAKTK